MVSNQKFDKNEIMNLWHDQLGHPGSKMMWKIIKNSI